MKWMLVGCLALLLLVFVLPFFGIEDISAYSGWIFGLIMIVCLLPMLLINRSKNNKKS
jgi:purine-cytosine permease-like protein